MTLEGTYLGFAVLVISVSTRPGKIVVNLTEDFPLLYIRISSLILSISSEIYKFCLIQSMLTLMCRLNFSN